MTNSARISPALSSIGALLFVVASAPCCSEAIETTTKTTEKLDQATAASAQQRVRVVQDAVQMFQMKEGRNPDSLDELVPDYIMADSAIADPWGNPLEMIEEDGKLIVVSWGANGEPDSFDIEDGHGIDTDYRGRE